MNHPTSNHNTNKQNNNHRRIVPPTRLSDILSTSSATKIIGQETCRVIIRNFLRSQISPVATTPPPTSVVSNNEQVKRKVGDIMDSYRDEVREGSSNDAKKKNTTSSSSDTTSSPPAKKMKHNEREVINVDEIDIPSDDDKEKNSLEWATVWTCDICKEKQFNSFEDAVEHERHCQGKQEEDTPQDEDEKDQKKAEDKRLQE